MVSPTPPPVNPVPKCSMCLEEYVSGRGHRAACTPCGHIFGETCLRTWLSRPDGQRCPACGKEATLESIRILYGEFPAKDLSRYIKLSIAIAEEELEDAKLGVAECAKSFDKTANSFVAPDTVRKYTGGDQEARLELFLQCATQVDAQDASLARLVTILDAYKGVFKKRTDARAAIKSYEDAGKPPPHKAVAELVIKERELGELRHRLELALNGPDSLSQSVEAAKKQIMELMTSRSWLYESFSRALANIRAEHAKLNDARAKEDKKRKQLEDAKEE